jgi:hypothetical protein
MTAAGTLATSKPPVTSGTDDVLAVLRAEFAELRQRVVALERLHAPIDDQARLLVIADEVKGRVFGAAELRDHAKLNPKLAEALGNLKSAKRIGKFLQKIANRPMGGVVLQRVGRDEHGTLWACCKYDPTYILPSSVPRGEGA